VPVILGMSISPCENSEDCLSANEYEWKTEYSNLEFISFPKHFFAIYVMGICEKGAEENI
jgi:hypothetical protein